MMRTLFFSIEGLKGNLPVQLHVTRRTNHIGPQCVVKNTYSQGCEKHHGFLRAVILLCAPVTSGLQKMAVDASGATFPLLSFPCPDQEMVTYPAFYK